MGGFARSCSYCGDVRGFPTAIHTGFTTASTTARASTATAERSMSVYIKRTVCPHCGEKHDRAGNVTGEGEPEPGDKTMCFRCGHWCVFDERQQLRKPTNEEMAQLAIDYNLPEIHMAWLQATQGKRP